MARKPRRNKSNRKEPKKPVPAPAFRELEQRINRVERSTEMKRLLLRHKGEIPVRVLWDCRGDHLEAMVTG